MPEPTTITPEQIAEFLALSQKVRSICWYAESDGIVSDTRVQVCCGRGIQECCLNPDAAGEAKMLLRLKEGTEEDLAYIAAACNLAPVLAREVEMLGAVVNAADAKCDEVLDAAVDSIRKLESQRDEFRVLYQDANKEVLELREQLARQAELVDALDIYSYWLDQTVNYVTESDLFLLKSIRETKQQCDAARACLAELEGKQ